MPDSGFHIPPTQKLETKPAKKKRNPALQVNFAKGSGKGWREFETVCLASLSTIVPKPGPDIQVSMVECVPAGCGAAPAAPAAPGERAKRPGWISARCFPDKRPPNAPPALLLSW